MADLFIEAAQAAIQYQIKQLYIEMRGDVDSRWWQSYQEMNAGQQAIWQDVIDSSSNEWMDEARESWPNCEETELYQEKLQDAVDTETDSGVWSGAFSIVTNEAMQIINEKKESAQALEDLNDALEALSYFV